MLEPPGLDWHVGRQLLKQIRQKDATKPITGLARGLGPRQRRVVEDADPYRGRPVWKRVLVGSTADSTPHWCP